MTSLMWLCPAPHSDLAKDCQQARFGIVVRPWRVSAGRNTVDAGSICAAVVLGSHRPENLAHPSANAGVMGVSRPEMCFSERTESWQPEAQPFQRMLTMTR